MAQTYSIEFKEEACKRVQSGVPAAQVARELGVNVNTLYTVTRHFIVDEKSILFSTVSTPLRHLHFADRTLLSTKLCSQIKIFRLELCVQ